MFGAPKKFEKGFVQKYYLRLMGNLGFVLRTKNPRDVESGNIDTKRFRDEERNTVKDAVEAFVDLHDLIFDIGELFFRGFVFTGRKERVGRLGRVKIEDWSEIKEKLKDFAVMRNKKPELKEDKEHCKRIMESIGMLDGVFKRISIQLR